MFRASGAGFQNRLPFTRAESGRHAGLYVGVEVIDLEAIGMREKLATPGPWIFGEFVNDTMDDDVHAENGQVICRAPEEIEDGWDLDMDFIAHARQDIPDLIAEVRRLRALVEEK